MAKFCNQCGKLLVEGEVCSCQSQTTAQPIPNTVPVNNSAEQVTKQVQGANVLVMTIITLILCLVFNSEAGGFIKLPVVKMVFTSFIP